VSRRVVLISSAVVIAAIGTLLVFLYVNSANERALAGQTTVKVLVANSDIGAGTPVSAIIDRGLLDQKTLPASAVSDSALSSTSPISKKISRVSIYKGQQILPAMFGTSTQQQTVAISHGHVAMSVSLGDPERVAGYVNPGGHVAVFMTTKPDSGQDSTKAKSRTRVLLGRVEVVAVGAVTTTPTQTQSSQRTPASTNNALLTLAVTQQQAEKVIFGQAHGDLYFALVNGKSKVRQDHGVGTDNLFTSA
jgi:pilus assembly protein CpaB